VPPAVDSPVSGSATQLHLQLNSPSGVPGGDLIASGVGCEPGARVQFLVEGHAQGQTVADGKGAFRGRVQVPSLGVGLHEIAAQCGGQTLSIPFTVVIATAVASAPSSVVASVMAFFVLIGLLLLLVRPLVVGSPGELEEPD